MKLPIEVQTRWGVRVPMRDGVKLAADLYLPQSDAGAPGLLLLTPFNRQSDDFVRYGRFFASHGYVVALIDTRGRGDSEGTFLPHIKDAVDGYDAVEWMASQEFCNAKVATLGEANMGSGQWLTALEKPPHLIAMISANAPPDPQTTWPTGTPTPSYLAWLFLTSDRMMQNVDAVHWEQVYRYLPLITMDEATGRQIPLWRAAFGQENVQEDWARMSYQQRFREIDLPILHISGWFTEDPSGTLRNYIGMTGEAQTERVRRSQRLIVGPWGAAVNGVRQLGEVDFGPQALIDLDDMKLRFLDCFLKGQDNGVAHEPPINLFVMGANQWRHEREWPLARATYAKYFLHSLGRANSLFGDGILNYTRPLDEVPDAFIYDPVRPVPFIMAYHISPLGGPDDYAAIERRDDVLVYDAEVLLEAMEVTGPVIVELFAQTDAVDTDFMAKLLDVWPTGFAQRLTDGMVHARFRQGMAQSELVEPHQIYRYEINCGYTSHVFLPGHRIRLEVTSSAFPKFDRNLNTGDPLGQDACAQIAHQVIYHDQDHPTAVILPMIVK